MQEIINTNVRSEVSPIELRDYLIQQGSNPNRIFLAEKGNIQSVLAKFKRRFLSSEHVYVWVGFYLDQTKRTKYSTLQEAIESRFDKKQKVYVLDNKNQLKKAIRSNGKL